jgi:hypothetical protein
MDVQGITARIMARFYADAGLALTFRHPTTRANVSLVAVDRSSVTIIKDEALEVSAVKPCCTVLSADLAALNVSPAQMADVPISLAGIAYRILSVHDKPDPSFRVVADQLKPVPNWQARGEILFVLMVL